MRLSLVPHFDGATYEPALDHVRLASQFQRVAGLMADGQWRTLEEIQNVTGGSLPAISARLRDLRKEKFGAWVVNRRRIEGGLYEYQVERP